ncbi:MAG: Maf family protein [Lachnospiraceae bacterium]|nr:Maf family protein [Lachnospiraceae bacterium]
MKRIILASASPRRRELLLQVGITPEIEPSHVDEVITSTDPEAVVMSLSRQKAEDIAGLHAGEEAVVVGADTVVAVDGTILGKPKNRGEAVEMIAMLQGRKHQVYTGVTVIDCGGAGRTGARETMFAEQTDVEIYPMTAEQIERYVDTGEPMDKAGAYGIQGRFAAHVKGISGDYNNVVGLPVGRLCQEWIL